MADEESGAGAPPRPGGEENPEARKKSTAKKKPGKTEAKLAACKPGSAAPKTSEKPKTAPPPSAKPDAARSGPTMPAGSGATPSYGESSESENMRGGFLALWGPATMLVFVVLMRAGNIVPSLWPRKQYSSCTLEAADYISAHGAERELRDPS